MIKNIFSIISKLDMPYILTCIAGALFFLFFLLLLYGMFGSH